MEGKNTRGDFFYKRTPTDFIFLPFNNILFWK